MENKNRLNIKRLMLDYLDRLYYTTYIPKIYISRKKAYLELKNYIIKGKGEQKWMLRN